MRCERGPRDQRLCRFREDVGREKLLKLMNEFGEKRGLGPRLLPLWEADNARIMLLGSSRAVQPQTCLAAGHAAKVPFSFASKAAVRAFLLGSCQLFSVSVHWRRCDLRWTALAGICAGYLWELGWCISPASLTVHVCSIFLCLSFVADGS